MRLGHAYLESARLPRLVQPFLQRIAGGTQEIAYLGVIDGESPLGVEDETAVQQRKDFLRRIGYKH